MELEQARKRAEELRVIIEKNNRLYYDQDAPELEDFEYDALNRDAGIEGAGSAVPRAGHGQLTHAACGRHGQQQIQQGDPCRQDGEPAGCVLV